MQKTAFASVIETDSSYAEFERQIADRVAAAKGPLFTTDAEGMFEAYLAGISEEFRQHYNCRCCQRFIERFGSLAAIDQDQGKLVSFMWGFESPPVFFARSAASMDDLVRRAKITGVFISGETVWGNPQTGDWSHLSGKNPCVFRSAIKSDSQESAEKLQDFIMLKRGLAEIPVEAVVQAVRVLQADAVDRSEKTLGVAEWLLDLHRQIENIKGPRRDNLIWLAVAKAPAGWCHIRSTMISTLLDDVIQGLPFDAIKTRWDAKMHPLRYQRPQAEPKAGNIEQANKIVEKLQSEGSLARRFARLEEVMALWRPSPIEPTAKKPNGGAFDHLKAKSLIKEVGLPAAKISWDKFRETVLPTACEIEINAPSHGAYFGLVTAVNADAPPILQWDGIDEAARNPVSWYFWHGGSSASQWGISAGWQKVAAICLKPCYWQKPDLFGHQGKGVFFVIDAMRESRESHGGLFPECLRAEYHGIRSVIESHSRQAVIVGKESGNANGLALDGGNVAVRVKGKGGLATYSVSL